MALEDTLWGVGDKVANCVSLFGLEKLRCLSRGHSEKALRLALLEIGLYLSHAPLPDMFSQFLTSERYAGYASQFLLDDRIPPKR